MRRLITAALMLVTVAIAGFGQIPQTGLVLWVPFSDSSYQDSSVSHVTFTAVPRLAPPTPTAGHTGDANSAYSFIQGQGKWFEGSDSLMPQGAHDRTLCAWIATTSPGTRANIIGYGDTNPGHACHFYLTQNGNNKYLKLSNKSDSISYSCVGHALSATTNGTWLHVCAVISGTTTLLYVDGAQVASATISSWNTTRRGLGIGGAYITPYNGGLSWQGKLDNIAIYNRALSSAEIQEVYNESYTHARPITYAIRTGKSIATKSYYLVSGRKIQGMNLEDVVACSQIRKILVTR